MFNNMPSIQENQMDDYEILTPKESVKKVIKQKKEEDSDFKESHSIDKAIGKLTKIGLVNVVDGDTMDFEIEGEEVRVRLIGVDTPESAHPNEELNTPQGKVASDFAKKILNENKDNLYIEYDREKKDIHGRDLGYIWIGDKMLNEILVEEGYAEPKIFLPNNRYAEDFEKIKNYAEYKKKGFWGEGVFEGDREIIEDVAIEEKEDIYDVDTDLHEKISQKFTQNEGFNKLNTSFSGVDTKLTITFQGGKPITIGEVQTVTYSLFRPIEPVYSLGDAKPTGFVRGQRTIAGSVIFTVFDRNVLLNAFYNAYAGYENKKCVNQPYLTDELPPFDMHITFMNEYGVSSALLIEGCYVPTEGQVHSVEDMITENTLQYVAQDITLMRPGDIT